MICHLVDERFLLLFFNMPVNCLILMGSIYMGVFNDLFVTTGCGRVGFEILFVCWGVVWFRRRLIENGCIYEKYGQF